MALETIVAKKELIPAGLEAAYVEREGKWHLDVKGDAADEYRKNNIALAQQLRDQAKRFEGIDPDALRAEKAKLDAERVKLEEAAALKAGELDRVVELRSRAAREASEKKAADSAAEAARYLAELAIVKIDQAVVAEATKRGLRATALKDITARAKSTFRLVDGVPQAVESDGTTVRLAKDGMAALSIAEWIDGQVSEAPHLFESNAGGGAAGNVTGGGGIGGRAPAKNPWKKESLNITEQMRITKSDPQMAARLEAAA